ncbi:MAG: Uma2 family endonuclease [Polyangiaceae bacterium]
MASSDYSLDPSDPRAPSEAQWRAMSEAQRARVLDSLPSDFPRATPPEGDRHRIPKAKALEALDEYFRRIGRRVYLSSELPVYYPEERVFAPDLIAVLDVECHERNSWVVSHEQRGIDLALEVHIAGDAKKDAERNVERFARLGIPEYFMFEPLRGRITGYRLRAGESAYAPIIPQHGRWPSSVLQLDLSVEGGRVRFYHGSAPLPDARELIERLSTLVDDAVDRAEEEARRAEEEARRAEEEARRAEEEARRADRLANKLRELGVDPDDLD